MPVPWRGERGEIQFLKINTVICITKIMADDGVQCACVPGGDVPLWPTWNGF
jgi:hypothetical protein